MNQTLDEIRTIADSEAAKSGYEIQNKNVVIDVNRENPDIAALLKNIEKNESLKNQLKGKNYIVVHYRPFQKPGRHIVGGEFIVFLERDTKKVLFSFALK